MDAWKCAKDIPQQRQTTLNTATMEIMQGVSKKTIPHRIVSSLISILLCKMHMEKSPGRNTVNRKGQNTEETYRAQDRP